MRAVKRSIPHDSGLLALVPHLMVLTQTALSRSSTSGYEHFQKGVCLLNPTFFMNLPEKSVISVEARSSPSSQLYNNNTSINNTIQTTNGQQLLQPKHESKSPSSTEAASPKSASSSGTTQLQNFLHRIPLEELSAADLAIPTGTTLILIFLSLPYLSLISYPTFL